MYENKQQQTNKQPNKQTTTTNKQMSSTISKRTVTCSQCRVKGHNKRSCPNKHVTLRSEERREMMCRNNSLNEQTDTCSICLEACGKCKTTLECGHIFDTSCIFNWLRTNDTCPYCRDKVPQLKRSEQPIKLPGRGIVGAMYRLCDDAVGEQFTSLPAEQRIHVWYIMFKSELESLSSSQYDDLLSLDEE